MAIHMKQLMKQRMKQLGFSSLLAIGVLFLGLAQAGEHLSISATTEFSEIHPGDSGILAITLEIDEGWHTYWPGVSDSGMGFKLEIDTSESITLEDPIWPTPKRYLQPGEILDFIYEETATVLVPFRIAGDASVGELLVFDIDADYLVCEEVCLPENASALASIAVIDAQSTKSPTASHDTIRELYDARPETFDPKADHVRVQWIAYRAAIMFRDATKIEFFPSRDCTELADPITSTVTETNRLILKFATSENKVIAGRIRSYERIGPVDYDIHITPAN